MQTLESPAKRARTSVSGSRHESIITLVSSDAIDFRVAWAIAERSEFVRNMFEGNTEEQSIAAMSLPATLSHPSCKAEVLQKIIDYLIKHDSGATREDKDKFDKELMKAGFGLLFDLALASDYLDIPDLLLLSSNTIAESINSSKTADEMRQNFGNLNVEDDTRSEAMKDQRNRVFQLVAVDLRLVPKLKKLMMCFQAFDEWNSNSFSHIDARGIGCLGGEECDALSGMKLLESLDLSYNTFPPKVDALLMNMTALKWLNLACVRCYEAGIHSVGYHLALPLSLMTGLQTLNLAGNPLCVEGARALLRSLSVMTGLQTLNLGFNRLEAEQATELAALLKLMTCLQSLYLEGNTLRVKGARALLLSLSVMTGLQTLDLGHNALEVEGARALAPSLSVMTGLKTLNLGWNPLGAKGARALAQSLSVMTGLQTLDFRSTSLGDEGARALAPSLIVMTVLQSLELMGNSLGAEGARALASSLSVLKGLKTLNLGWNPLEAEGARALAPSLIVMTGLQTLDLGHTSLGDEGAAALAPSLILMTGLKTLNLGWNSLEAEGSTALVPSLIAMTGLQSLTISSKYCGAEGASALVPSLRVMTWLRVLSLADT